MSLSAFTDEDAVDILFHGTAFNLSVCVEERKTEKESDAEPMLAIDLEQLGTGDSWHAEFSSSFLESITSKTGRKWQRLAAVVAVHTQPSAGSFKRFPVLVKMMLSAMRQETDTVALDLLTYADLEMLKSKKTGKPVSSSPANAATASRSSKRYLILTYAVEFDRVHYPLPLSPAESPSIAVLQRQIRRLRKELALFRSFAGITDSAVALAPSGLPGATQATLITSVSGIQKEVEASRTKCSELQSHIGELNDALREANSRLNAAQEAAAANDAALEKLRQASRAEVKRLRGDIVELRTKLHDTENALSAASESAIMSTGARESEIVLALKDTNEQLRDRIKELSRQVAAMSVARSSEPSLGSRADVRGRPGSVASGRSVSSRASSTGSVRSKGLDRLSTSPFARPAVRPHSASSRSASVASHGSASRPSSAPSKPLHQPGVTHPSSQAAVSRGRTPVRSTAAVPTTRASPSNRIGGQAARSASNSSSRMPQPPAAAQSRVPSRSPSATTRAITSNPINATRTISSVRAAPAGNPVLPGRQVAQPAGRSPSPVSSARSNISPYANAMDSIISSVQRRYRETLYPEGKFDPNASTASSKFTSNSISAGSAARATTPPVAVPASAPTRAGPRNTSKLADGDHFFVVPAPAVARHTWAPDAGAPRATSPAGHQGSLPLNRFSIEKTGAAEGTSANDIAEIDARLQQLQDFLKAAKSGGPLPSMPGSST